jgi:rhodanese-related sulfurtransferase
VTVIPRYYLTLIGLPYKLQENCAMSKKKTQTRSAKQPTGLSQQARGWLIAAGILVVALVAIFAVYQANAPAGAAEAALPAEISVAQAHTEYQSGTLMLDVRTQEEWDQVHIPGATFIPLDQLENRLAELPRDQEIVVYCRSGNRSQTGRDILLDAGFTQVTSMAGGINQWSSAGFPTEP